MDKSYSVWADLLNKFHTSSDWIQALWLMAPAVTVLGITYLAAQVARETLRIREQERPQPESPPDILEGSLLYGIYRNARGELILYRHGISETSSQGEPLEIKRLQ